MSVTQRSSGKRMSPLRPVRVKRKMSEETEKCMEFQGSFTPSARIATSYFSLLPRNPTVQPIQPPWDK